jgi:LEA14-like dessication related protein
MRFLSGAFTLLFAALFASCIRVKPLEFTGIRQFTVHSISNKGMEGDVHVRVRNPNNFGFKIYKGHADFTFAGVNLGTASMNDRVKIRGGQDSVYVFHIKTDFSDFSLEDILRVLAAGSRQESLEINGHVTAGKFLIRKKVPVALKEPVLLR